MIQALLFDVGGVLVRTEDRRPRQMLEQRLGLEPGGAEQLVFNSAMGQHAQLGLITTADLWQWVGAELDLDAAGLQAFQAAFWGGDRLDETLVDLIRGLHGRYQTAIISNAADNLRDVVTRTHRMADAFDLIVGSADEGVMKPDAAIFTRTLARLGRQPHEAVFVDDFLHNIDGARAVGLHAIHFTPEIDLAAALAAYGVLVG